MHAGMGLPPVEYGQIITLIYLKVSLSDFLTLFSCRTQESFFWTVKPGKPLMAAVFVSLTISTFLASYWPKGTLDGLPVMGLALGGYTVHYNYHKAYSTLAHCRL
jgi:H+-transporting ATPase